MTTILPTKKFLQQDNVYIINNSIKITFVFDDVIYLRKVRMMKFFKNIHFIAQERRIKISVLDFFHNNIFFKSEMIGKIHHAHTAAADFFNNTVSIIYDITAEKHILPTFLFRAYPKKRYARFIKNII